VVVHAPRLGSVNSNEGKGSTSGSRVPGWWRGGERAARVSVRGAEAGGFRQHRQQKGKKEGERGGTQPRVLWPACRRRVRLLKCRPTQVGWERPGAVQAPAGTRNEWQALGRIEVRRTKLAVSSRFGRCGRPGPPLPLSAGVVVDVLQLGKHGRRSEATKGGSAVQPWYRDRVSSGAVRRRDQA